MEDDPTPSTCHFCGSTYNGDWMWWNLREYRGALTGLACNSCINEFEAATPEHITNIVNVRLVAQKLEPR